MINETLNEAAQKMDKAVGVAREEFAEAVDEIRRYSGRQFDPRVVEAFVGSFREDDIQEA